MNTAGNRIKYKILVCDTDETTRNKTLSYLDNDFTEIKYTDNGMKAFDLIKSGYYDLLITDLIMFDIDGLELIDFCKKHAPQTCVIVFTDLLSRDIIKHCITSGVRYVLSKDNLDVLCDRVRHVLKGKIDLPKLNINVLDSISNRYEYILMDMGFKPSHKGFSYLVTALMLNEKDPDYSTGITKLLYPEIARLNKDKTHNVEKLIRKAIEYAWDRRFNTGFIKYLEFHERNTRVKPTNAEFISVVSSKYKIIN